MLKILYFSGGYQFFQISPEIKSLHDRGRKPIHLLEREAKFATGDVISTNVSTEKATRAHLIGALGQGEEVVFWTTVF